MHWQAWITTLLVAACASYSLWSLMPRSWQRRVALWRGKPVPASTSGCGGCEGCGSAKPTAPGATGGASVIRIVRPPPRR